MPTAALESPDRCWGALPCQPGRSRRPEPGRGLGSWRGPRKAKHAGIPAWEKEGSDSSLPVPTGQTLPGRDSYAPRSAQAQQQLPAAPQLLRQQENTGIRHKTDRKGAMETGPQQPQQRPAPLAAGASAQPSCRLIPAMEAEKQKFPCQQKTRTSGQTSALAPAALARSPHARGARSGDQRVPIGSPWTLANTKSQPLSLPSRVILPMPIPLLRSELAAGFWERTISRASASDVQCPLGPYSV